MLVVGEGRRMMTKMKIGLKYGPFFLRTFLFDKIQMLEGIRESKCICLVFVALNVPPAFADRQRHLQRAQVSLCPPLLDLSALISEQTMLPR